MAVLERRTKTATGARAFGVVAPKVWHDLPDSIRSSDSIISFKNNLKTYLFNQALPPDLPPIHCDLSLKACLDSTAPNVDVNLT